MKDEAKLRKPYEKPELRVIEMREEEVMAVGCKTLTGAAASGNPGCGILAGCNAQGS